MGDGRRHQPHGSHQSAGYAGPGHDRACRQPAPGMAVQRHGFGERDQFRGSVPSQGRGQRPAPLRQPVGTARPARTPAAAGRRPLHDHGSRRTGQMVPGCGIRRAPLRQSRGVGSGAHGLPRFCRQPDVRKQEQRRRDALDRRIPPLHGFRNFLRERLRQPDRPGRGRL